MWAQNLSKGNCLSQKCSFRARALPVTKTAGIQNKQITKTHLSPKGSQGIISKYYKKSWWTFRIYFNFFCSMEGKRESEAMRGGRFLFVEIPGGGGERPGGCLQGIWGGGGGVAKYFSGPKSPPSYTCNPIPKLCTMFFMELRL